ncbi:hypothetical protein LB565_20165 [Mesorhizobium sp. CA14]|uniref:hypothetical protein n=1 Tax=Mesorhizobium sp. CA14 TaxID=2876642 RepID=UPI001CCBCBFB|nr:hypothetical protein [Mesorhizobium sp. CA14]MBZ9850299.1 hypothetical protein [Mesorhizobium sp. CA14]
MKIAVGIIGILLGIITMLQSCAVATGGNILANQELAGAGSVGVLVGLLFFVGGAFAFGLPLVAAIVFVVGSFFALIAINAFPDMKVWAVADLLLAAMAFFAWRSARRSGANVETSG